jgi:hypothetical protein
MTSAVVSKLRPEVRPRETDNYTPPNGTAYLRELHT